MERFSLSWGKRKHTSSTDDVLSYPFHAFQMTGTYFHSFGEFTLTIVSGNDELDVIL
jgi:hypothetical protein